MTPLNVHNSLQHPQNVWKSLLAARWTVDPFNVASRTCNQRNNLEPILNVFTRNCQFPSEKVARVDKNRHKKFTPVPGFYKTNGRCRHFLLKIRAFFGIIASPQFFSTLAAVYHYRPSQKVPKFYNRSAFSASALPQAERPALKKYQS